MPPSGSWNTRASSRARSAAPCAVTSAPSIAIRPAVARAVPASALSSVDLPAPLLPITVTNWPCGIARSTPRSARVSSTVPGWKVTSTPWSSITVPAPSRASSRARVAGRTSAPPTSTAVTRLRSEACSPSTSASSATATAIR